MLVIDNHLAARIEKLADKMTYVLEKIVELRHLDTSMPDAELHLKAMDVLGDMHDLSLSPYVQEAYELFKNIANARTDRHMLKVHPELVKLRKMVDMAVRNEGGPYDDPPSDDWVRRRIAEYEEFASKQLKGEDNG